MLVRPILLCDPSCSRVNKGKRAHAVSFPNYNLKPPTRHDGLGGCALEGARHYVEASEQFPGRPASIAVGKAAG